METITIRQSWPKVALFTLATIGAAFVCGLISKPDNNWQIGFYLLNALALVFVAMLIFPAKLVLDQRGFTIVNGFTQKGDRIAWSDVEAFTVVRIRYNRYVGFRRTAQSIGTGTKIVGHLIGSHGILHGFWPGSAKSLAAKLETYRFQALASAVDRSKIPLAVGPAVRTFGRANTRSAAKRQS